MDMLQENVSLKEFITMKTGGFARYFFCVKSIEEVKDAVLFAKKESKPIFILGGGSNIIFPDNGFDGVVIKMEIEGVNFEKIDDTTMSVVAGAGVVWDELVEETVSKGLYGLENLSFIPGTVGASPVQNIGAYGVEVKDAIVWVEVLDTETLDVKKISNKECVFDYRNSFFKTPEGKKFIILNVAFNLKKKEKLKINYGDIEEYFSKKDKTPTLKILREAIIEIRTNKLPDIKKVGTAGSFFKNPIVSKEKMQQLLKTYPNLKYSKINNDTFKLSAAWLLDNVGNYNGVCRAGVCVYEKQPLVLINRNNSTAAEILSFAKQIKENIKTKTEINLEFEVVVV